MNIYIIIILSTLIIGYLLDLIADYLNLKHLVTEVPEEFNDVYDDEKYKKSQEYTKVKTKFGFISSTFSLIVMMIFWFSGGFNLLDIWLRTLIDNEILRGLTYVGLIMLTNSILTLPFGIYSTFVIEEKFGFNKTTIKTFILDLLKGLLLALVIGGVLLGAILYIFNVLDEFAWLYTWLTVVVFTLVLQFIAPTWIMPIFNKFTPLEEGELKNSIMNYSKKVNFSLKNVFVMDGSKRSSKSNAFFTGFGKNKRIALFDTLIKSHTIGELVAVLAHEIGHYKKKHIIKGMFISIIHTGILFLLLSIFLNEKSLYGAFFMDNISIYTGLLFFGMLYSPIEMILSLFMNINSRKNEFEADKFAACTVDNKEDMVNALKKLSKDNLSNLTPHPFYVFLNYSHPPVLDRISVIRKNL